MENNRSYRGLLLIASIGMSCRLLFIWTGLAEKILVADDAYYYFTIARNIASGFGPTFDRLAPTNGFHPLWLMVLVPLYKLFGYNFWLPVRLALSMATIFDLFSGLLIYKLLRNNESKKVALIAVSIWFLSPFTMLIGLRGMEVSLSCFLTLLLCWYIIKAGAVNSPLKMKSFIVGGLLLGLAGLARIDNLLILGAVVAIFILITERRSISRTFKGLLAMSCLAFIVTLPWFLWNYLNFGSVLQVSGRAKFYLVAKSGSYFAGCQSLIGIVRTLAYTVLAPFVFPAKFLGGEDFQSPEISIAIILGLMLILAIPILFVRKAIRKGFDSDLLFRISLFSALYLLVHIIIYGFLVRFYAVWYGLPFYAFFAILLGISIPELLNHLDKHRGLRTFAIISLILFNVLTYPLYIFRIYNKVEKPEACYGQTLTTMANSYPNGVVVGAFNAGAIGYIAPEYGKLTIVNLDCLVNNKAFEAAKSGKYFSYVTETIDLFYENPRGASIFLLPSETDSLCSIYRWQNDRGYWAKY